MTIRNLIAISLLATATPALAQADSFGAAPSAWDGTDASLVAPVPPKASVTRTWYGWQILLADAALIGGAMVAGDEALDMLLPALALSGPTIHILNGHPGRAAGSLGMRVGLPIGTGLLLSAGCTGWDCLATFAGGFLIGGATAEVIDVAWSRSEVLEDLPVRPMVNATETSAVLGLGGAF
jgi:hypothetical protein